MTRPSDLVGATVFVVGSGPSLRLDDLEAIRASAAPSIATNLCFRVMPWAWGVFCYDHNFIRQYAEQLRQHAGVLMTAAPIVPEVERFVTVRGVRWVGQDCAEQNSGSMAAAIAVACGARRVVLLGMDCQRTGGATHWHGDHRKPLNNALSIKAWPRAFAKVRRLADGRGCQVVNASRETALTCFPRVDLAQELAAVKQHRAIAPTPEIEKINI